METEKEDDKKCECGQFKSYYVVWKLDPPVSEDIDDMSFKSYYVVWKPATRHSANRLPRKFKSYYVVWKQLQIDRNPLKLYRLNRTMQYGNYALFFDRSSICSV